MTENPKNNPSNPPGKLKILGNEEKNDCMAGFRSRDDSLFGSRDDSLFGSRDASVFVSKDDNLIDLRDNRIKDKGSQLVWVKG
jgi:hypothetical protein